MVAECVYPGGALRRRPNDGQPQPVRFNLNEPVRLTDSMGAGATLWFREMVGASCVFDYRYER